MFRRGVHVSVVGLQRANLVHLQGGVLLDSGAGSLWHAHQLVHRPSGSGHPDSTQVHLHHGRLPSEFCSSAFHFIITLPSEKFFEIVDRSLAIS